jgi:hypothetical protein
MVNGGWAWLLALLLTAAVVGCSSQPDTRQSTGAEAAVRLYYEALIHKDWSRAYAMLHPESQKRYGSEQFGRLAQNYRKGLGFEPREVRIRACEEHGSEAVAHVMVVGQAAGKQRTYNDAITLGRSGSEWGVILPPHFGDSR